MQTPSGDKRPRRADSRRNHERILESAKAAFAEYGAEAQMDEIAERAAVGVGTVYRHFPTKEALMAELVGSKFRRMSATARQALTAEGEPFAVFADLLRRNAEVTASDAALQHTLMRTGERILVMARTEQEELQELVGELMERAQRAGTMRSDVGPSDIAGLMCGVSASMAHGDRGFDWRRQLELVIDALRAR